LSVPRPAQKAMRNASCLRARRAKRRRRIHRSEPSMVENVIGLQAKLGVPALAEGMFLNSDMSKLSMSGPRNTSLSAFPQQTPLLRRCGPVEAHFRPRITCGKNEMVILGTIIPSVRVLLVFRCGRRCAGDSSGIRSGRTAPGSAAAKRPRTAPKNS
jgi:hypothetical protein